MKKELLYKKLSYIFDLDIKKIKPQLSLQSIKNWDSLKHMQLIFFIEKTIKKKIVTKDINRIKKISDIEKIFKK
tara:strand:+ start:112 stop:333 length:222 start_codon:yes stop_codon:yes gene_type:complete